MASVSVKDVQSLNKRIEKINTEKTRVETRSQMLKDQILSDIKAYKDKFGVDLGAESFSEIKKLIAKEAKKVASEVSDEYELKEKVVSCIEQGDIDGANKLLGIVDTTEDASEEPLEKEDVEVEAEEEIKSAEEDFELDTMEPISSKNDDLVIEEDDSMDMSSDTGDLDMSSDTGVFDMSVDDDDEDEDDEDDPFGFGDMLSGGKF